MKNIPLSEKQNWLVMELSANQGSYISKSPRMGYYLVLDGDVKDRINPTTINAMLRKHVLKQVNENRIELWQNQNTTGTEETSPILG